MKKLFQWFGIDRAVFFNLLSKIWNVGAGLVTLAVITHFLSPELQGYYYTFNSLIALQIFAELGLNFAIVQFASHEMAQLTWKINGTVTGSQLAKRRLQSLLQFSLAWFGVAALVMVALLLPSGLLFFSTEEPATLTNNEIAIPWILLVVFTAINLIVNTASAILEGCGKIQQIAIMRLCKSIFSTAIVWLVLAFDGKLFALSISSLIMAFIGITWLWINHRHFFKDLLTHQSDLPGMGWQKEIWPFQWRIALSWASGFFIFQLFNPLIFKIVGPVAAGQMGMTMQIFAALNGTAMVWIITKVPTYGQLIASGQRNKLDFLFFKGFMQSGLFLLMGIVALWSTLYYSINAGLVHAQRVLPFKLFSVLCIVSLANHIVFAEAAYLRAHKEEPFMIISIASGILTLIMAFLLIPLFGLNGAVASYAVPALIFGLLGGSYIFYKKRNEWTIKFN